jgi:hypothetical protein
MSGTSGYPDSIDNYGVVADNVDYVEAGHINQLNDAVHKIETELGTDPKGSYNSVKDAIDSKASKVSNPTNGNFAALNSSGDITDSGHKDSDYADAVHTHDYSDLEDLPTLPANEAGSANNFLTSYNSTTGAFGKAQPTWGNVDKTTSSIADITTKSHTALTDIGTNTHAQIDTQARINNFIGWWS